MVGGEEKLEPRDLEYVRKTRLSTLDTISLDSPRAQLTDDRPVYALGAAARLRQEVCNDIDALVGHQQGGLEQSTTACVRSTSRTTNLWIRSNRNGCYRPYL